MIGKTTPIRLLLAVALGVAVTGILLSVFYGQYRSLANQIVETSSAEYQQLVEADFEILANTEIRAAADAMGEIAAGGQLFDISQILNTILIDNHALTGTRFVDSSGNTFEAGSIPDSLAGTSTIWLKQLLLVSKPVVADGVEVGQLTGAFDLADLRTESARFEAALGKKQLESRQVSYIWVGAGTLAALLLCGGVIWLSVLSQNKRIRQLKIQAEKLRRLGFWRTTVGCTT